MEQQKTSAKVLQPGNQRGCTGLAVVFNLVVGKLPVQYRNVDLSQTKLSTIGDTTKELVSNLDQDVTIYQIAESGSENETIQKLSGALRGSFPPM